MNEEIFTIYNSSGDAVYIIKQNEVIEVSADSSPIVQAIVSADSSADSSLNADLLSHIDNNTYNLSMGLILCFTLYIIFREIRWWR